jgi:hypothetical protein
MFNRAGAQKDPADRDPADDYGRGRGTACAQDALPPGPL